MRHTSRFFRWLVGLIVGAYLAVMLLFSVPAVQRWMARGVGALLEDVTGTEVTLGRLQVDWNGRVIVDGLSVMDLEGEELLRVARVAARLNVGEFLRQRIRIRNAQLFGLRANLYQERDGDDPNFKFLIDAFASKDTTQHKPLDLRVSQILVRRGSITWHQRWQPDTTTLSLAHLELSDLDVTAQLNVLTDDSLNLRVKRFDVCERRGLCIKGLSFSAVANRQGGALMDFCLEMPRSRVTIPAATVRGLDTSSVRYLGELQAHLDPQDFASVLPRLASVREVADLNVQFRGENDDVSISTLRLQDGDGMLRLLASGRLRNLQQGRDSLDLALNIHSLHAETALLRPYVQNEILNRLGSIELNGTAALAQQAVNAAFRLQTPLGGASVKGSGTTSGEIDASVQSDGFQLGELLNKSALGLLAVDMNVSGRLGQQPTLTASGRISEVEYKGYRYRNIRLEKLDYQASAVSASLSSGDPNASFEVSGDADLAHHHYMLKADLSNLSPHVLNLTKRYSDTRFSGTLFADLAGTRVSNIEGVVHLNDFCMADTAGAYRPGDIHLTSRSDGDEGHIMLISPFVEAQLNGLFDPKEIATQVKHMVSLYLPTEDNIGLPEQRDEQPVALTRDELTAPMDLTSSASFLVRLYSAEPLQRLLGIPLNLQGTTVTHGNIDSRNRALWMELSSPGIDYGNEQLRNIRLHLESNYESLVADAQLQRQMKERWVNLGLETVGNDGRLTTRLFFDNKTENGRTPQGASNYAGELNLVTRLWRDVRGKQGFEGRIQHSDFIIGDTLWTVHPGFVSYYDGQLQVDSFCVSQGDRFVRVDGRASQAETDTLYAQLQSINLEYIFSLINFHDVELTGEATGRAYAHSLFSSPKADAYIRIPQFALNYGTMGDLDIHVNWGQRPYSIFLDGDIADAPHQGRTLVKGYITPKKDLDYHGLDLNVKTERVNMEFLNKWTKTIFENLQGRASGWVRIFGPFKGVNIEGDVVVEEASLGVPFIGVRYHLQGDSVQLRPDNIYFSKTRIYDPQGAPGQSDHYAVVDGHLHHECFKNLSFDINIQGQNILGYNFTDFGDQKFYGKVLATGNLGLKGKPGQVNIDINVHPERGTSFTYNASSPGKLTETPFVTYVDPHLVLADGQENVQPADEPLPGGSDLRINFDLDIDDETTMNLLMDSRSGDKISLNGSGHMKAHYYNKGAFELFGTYRVSRGTYNLSLQEVIRKNFEFAPDGTIIFNGEPYNGDLNLQAVHTVSGVSLNDINPKANFSNTATRVNCLMNIGGKARDPRITFDFDIPNANEEEKQMVRALISTEEERNMQVIYLLGIGRFYAYDYTNNSQTQGTTAMYSVLSSTLSGTINQALSNMIGSSKWNFGANLRTGQDGWNDMDVEGMVQGNLLNNRLIINGNFGYRDTPVANSNFIGDFDVKYLLTRSGNVALKAYSETNDRYFTKSSLTTQGIGVLLKKDFTSLKDLVTKRKKKRRR